jgi:hypothetical protein
MTQLVTLMGLWSRHKRDCRPVGDIVADARAGRLPGVREIETGHGFRVVDEKSALNAMRRAN